MDIFSNFIPKEHYLNCVVNNKKFILEPTKKINFSDKPISIFNDYTPTFEELNKNPYNVLIILEPNQLHGLHDWAINNKENFSCILTWSEKILNSCESSMLLPFGTSFLHDIPEFYESFNVNNKKFEVSFLCGRKKTTNGHFLRHKIYENGDKIKINKTWIYEGPSDCKKPCWNSYFHIAVENIKENNWFTEKIIDGFLTKTIPIYWGCPNFNNYFDPNGYITFNTTEELVEIVNNLTPEYYFDRLDVIEKNYKSALYYGDFFFRINEILEQIVTHNNI